METKLKFTVDSALLKELGEKLVETVHVALSELVKNAYDADATEVEVIFENDNNGNGCIKIIDNGTGMNFDAVRNYWMRIATTNKESKNVSSVYGRHLTGAKGIGRFSCRRLGGQLTLITNGSPNGNLCGKSPRIESTKVIFPWKKFEAGKDVTTIVCPGEQTIVKNGYTGTTLIIEDISDEWTTRGLNWLKRQLAVLTANRGTRREGFIEDPGFLVMLIAPNFEGGIRDIRDDLINAGWGTLTAYINNKNQAVCELNALGLGRRNIISSQTFPKLKDLHLEVGIMVDDRSQMRDVSVISKQALNVILSQWGGIQIRYRGFRVYPYGNDDWLEIDKDRGLRKASPKNELFAFAESLRGVEAHRSLLNMLSMNSYIGNVLIGPKSEGFEMKANREGFIESEAVHQLKNFVRFAIDWTTILRDFYLRQQQIRISEIAKEEFENVIGREVESQKVVTTALDYINTNIKKVAEVLGKEERIVLENSLKKATDAIKTQNKSLLVELSHLRLVASASSLLLIFSHEVKSLLGLLEQSKNSLNMIAKRLSGKERETVVRIGQNFQDLNYRLEELLQLTSLISTNKTKTKPGRVALKSRIIKIEKIFELITNKYEIEIDHSDVPNNIVIKKILEAEVYSILINVISNSIKAVIAGDYVKNIKIVASSNDGEIIINVMDTGVGLNSDRYNEVFIPFVSDPDGVLYQELGKKLNPEDSIFVGAGSGLGLGIVREIVSAHGGTIRFKQPSSPWATEIEIKLR